MKKTSCLILCSLTCFLLGCVYYAPRPAYYTFEDLRNGLREKQWWFANANRPLYARIDLGYNPIYPASTKARDNTAAVLKVNPTKYRVKNTSVEYRWNDNYYQNFDWNRFISEGGQRGDLIFLRSNGKGPDLVKIFSNWVHIAIVDSASDRNVFEALPDIGVNVNYAPRSWSQVSYFTCKRPKDLNSRQIEQALDRAKRAYTGLPYFPKVETSANLATFLYRWCDKNNTESMYCSKLVYYTFKDYVNFDTNNTCTFDDLLQDKAPGAPLFSWIGISPDDIYYSDCLGYDFCYSSNLLNNCLRICTVGAN